MKLFTVLALALLCMASPSSAVLNILYQYSGSVSLAVNGRGSVALNPFTFPINKPHDLATVRQAYLFQTTVLFQLTPVPVTIAQGANPALAISTWDMTNVNTRFSASVKDVTSAMAAWLNPLAMGDATISVTESNTGAVDGEVLVIVWNRPDLSSARSVTLMFGAALTTGDATALLTFPSPLQYGVDTLTMGLGIGFSFDPCGVTPVQFSNVFVNGLQLSRTAGNYDLGEPNNGALLTVGTAARGAPYNPTGTPAVEICQDKEYYDVTQFMHSQGQDTITSISVTTNNPSADDNLFLAYFDSSAPSTVVTGTLAIGPINACSTQDVAVPAGLFAGNNGAPSVGVILTLTITAGPNVGFTQMQTTNSQGLVTFTVPHAPSGTTDTYQVSSVNPLAQASSTISWSVEACPDGGPTCPDSFILPATETFKEVTSSGKCVCLTADN